MNFDEMLKKWSKSKYPLTIQTSIIYYVNSASKQRKPVAILHGKFEKRKKSNIWVNNANSHIEVVAKTHLYDLDDDDQEVYNGDNSNKYLIHENNSNGCVAFCGEDQYIYQFDRSSNIVINLKPIFKTPPLTKTKTIDGKSFIHLDGISVMVIKEDIVLIECISGKINIHSLDVIDYNSDVSVSFNNELNKRELADNQSTIQIREETENASEEQSSETSQPSETDHIREQLLKFMERLEGYAVIAVKEDNLKVAQTWTDLIQS